MRTILLVLLGMLTVLPACATYRDTGIATSYVDSRQLDRVRVEQDEFRGTTTVIATPMVDSTGALVRWITLAASPGGNSILLSVDAEVQSGWKYLECHSLAFVIDGQPSPLDARHDGSILGTYAGRVKTREQVIASVDLAFVQRLAASQAARGRVCNDEFEITPRVRELLGEFLAKVSTP